MSSSSRDSDSLVLAVPPRFHFWRTVFSHGWCSLPPFSYDPGSHTLSRVFSVAGNRSVFALLRAGNRSVIVKPADPHLLTPAMKKELATQARTCLRLDDDITEFYSTAARIPQYRWIVAAGAGRLLRAPSVFEDAVKTICTTNCTWELTTLMVRNLVDALGHIDTLGKHRSFPSPESIAGATEMFMRSEIKSGYRSPFLVEFAERVAAGTLDVEAWRHSPLSTEDLVTAMRDVKGIGPYAAGNLLKLVGRYDELALDSWVRSKYYELHHRGRKVKDATIERAYAPYGKWRGLLFWLEMTRDWHDEKFRV
jgi:3-methyladenine DNA glycosylase/8-oxoguanine DNA glycosylase